MPLVFAALVFSLMSFGPAWAQQAYPCNAGLAHPVDSMGSDSVSIAYPGQAQPIAISVLPKADENSLVFAQSLENSWTNPIQSLHFNFASEKKGVHGQIHFCFQGPTSQLDENKEDSTEGYYNLDLNVRSNLVAEAKVLVSCDLRNKGSLRASRSAIETGPPVYEKDMSYSSASFMLQNQGSQFSVALNPSDKQVPRFCLIQIDFTEPLPTSDTDIRINKQGETSFEVVPEISFSKY